MYAVCYIYYLWYMIDIHIVYICIGWTVYVNSITYGFYCLVCWNSNVHSRKQAICRYCMYCSAPREWSSTELWDSTDASLRIRLQVWPANHILPCCKVAVPPQNEPEDINPPPCCLQSCPTQFFSCVTQSLTQEALLSVGEIVWVVINTEMK